MDQVTFEQLPQVVGEIRERLLRIEDHLEALLGSEKAPCYLSISEAAEFLNLAKSTLYIKVCRMEIPVHKKGKRLYFEKAELYHWIKNSRRKTREELQTEADQYLKLPTKKRRVAG